MILLIENKREELLAICNKLSVASLYVFGSVTSGAFGPDSDLDFMVSFSPELGVLEYSDNFFRLREELVSLFDRDIDLITESSLSNPYFISSLNASKQLVYAA